MRFWVDIEGAPHVLVFTPLIRELERRGHEVRVTARDYGQTIPLARMYGLSFKQIGSHWGKWLLLKYMSVLTRSIELLFFAIGKRFDLVFGNSRAVFLAAHLLKIPLVVIDDYEYSALPATFAKWMTLMLFPEVIPSTIFEERGFAAAKLCGYPGLKEDLYVHETTPDSSFLSEHGMDPAKVIVLLRPPATMAHYAVPESEKLFFEIMDYLSQLNDVHVLMLPRTIDQAKTLQAYLHRHVGRNIFFARRVYEGPRIILCSDLVISGGGTMNREAATLGIPVYSIYQGPMGCVDRHLIDTGKLKHVDRIEVVKEIQFKKLERPKPEERCGAAQMLSSFIVNKLLACAEGKRM